MTSRRSRRFMVWCLTLLVGFGIGTAVGQMSPPTENKGLDAKLVSTTLPKVQMPNRDGFMLDDRPDTRAVRCMRDCQ